jgi:hypothetical protein
VRGQSKINRLRMHLNDTGNCRGKAIQTVGYVLAPSVSNLAHWTNDTPSSDVKHWALLNVPPWAWTITVPLG